MLSVRLFKMVNDFLRRPGLAGVHSNTAAGTPGTGTTNRFGANAEPRSHGTTAPGLVGDAHGSHARRDGVRAR